MCDHEKKYYFAYGKNMDSQKLSERCKEKKMPEDVIQKIIHSRQKGLLNGYSIVFNKKADSGNTVYSNIENNNDDFVEGVLYNYDSDEFIKCLDKWECYPSHYEQKIVEVKTNDDEIIKAIVYVANREKIVENLKPKKTYIEHLLKAKDLLSKEYWDKLKKIWDQAI